MEKIDCKKCIHYDVCHFVSEGTENLEDNTDCYIPKTGKQGHWIESRSPSGKPLCNCSECDGTALSEDDSWGCVLQFYKTDFCPWCGAKMKE